LRANASVCCLNSHRRWTIPFIPYRLSFYIFGRASARELCEKRCWFFIAVWSVARPSGNYGIFPLTPRCDSREKFEGTKIFNSPMGKMLIDFGTSISLPLHFLIHREENIIMINAANKEYFYKLDISLFYSSVDFMITYCLSKSFFYLCSCCNVSMFISCILIFSTHLFFYFYFFVLFALNCFTISYH